MKKFSFLVLAAAGLLMTACADKDTVAEEGQFNQYNLIEGQSAWISVGIALPSDPVTRANEDLNDGIAAEYAVNTAKLVLFKGANEDEATLIKAYDITTEWSNETGDQVPGGGTDPNNVGEVSRTTTKIVKEIDSPKLGGQDNLYGYVILNDGNSGIFYTESMSFADFKAQVLKAIGIDDEANGYGPIDTDKGLVMTNVPIADHPGGNAKPDDATKVTTLALINKNAVYDTKAGAEAGTVVACIYVERAAVKVEVENKTSKIQLDATTNLDFTFNGWALGNVNYGGEAGTGYYNTRQFDEAWLKYNNHVTTPAYLRWRMVGRTDFFENGHTTAFRTYFGRDVNYTNALDATTGEFATTNLKYKKLTDAQYSLNDKGYTYTYENTFDENSQIWANTTYVGVKVTIAGGDFYTIDGQPNTRLTYDATNHTGTLAGEVAKNHSAAISTANSTIQTAIDADLGSSSSTLNAGKTAGSEITKISYKLNPVITFGDRNATTGAIPYTFTLQLTDVKNKIGTATEYTNMAEADVTKLNTLVAATLNAEHNGTTTVYKYTGGVTYYSARISHFGNVETPWSAPAEAYNQYIKVYPENGKSLDDPSVTYGDDRANAWLGRWGIVRNNWYKITIDEIKGIGSPVPEDYSGEAGKTPDDNPEPKYYIAAHVHILPWAVRNQSVRF